MIGSASRFGKGRLRLAAMILLSACAASCSSTGEQALELNSPAFTDSLQVPADVADPVAEAGGGASAGGKGKPAVPVKTAFQPAPEPAAASAAEQEIATVAPVEAAGPDKAQKFSIAASAPSPTGQVLANGGPILTAGTMPEPPAPARKKGFMSSLFGATQAQAEPIIPAIAAEQPRAKPLVKLASAEPSEKLLSLASLDGRAGSEPMDSLPGVRKDSLFEIKRKSGLNDDSDVDIHEDEDGTPVRLASVGGMARLAPNGLLKQRETVDVACLKPDLVRILKTVERHFGRKMVVTSGYRSPTYNRKVNGARKSQHMYCAAADVQLPGVSKWELAQYVRALPGRGGVGTYCHTDSVHIDVGPERDWNWRCRRRS